MCKFDICLCGIWQCVWFTYTYFSQHLHRSESYLLAKKKNKNLAWESFWLLSYMMFCCPQKSEININHFSSIQCNLDQLNYTIFYLIKIPLLPTGYNCSLFAYGQTGSGKSYSMVGYGQNKFVLVPLLFLAHMILFFLMKFIIWKYVNSGS